MWNSTSRPQRRPKPAASSRASAACRMRRVSIGHRRCRPRSTARRAPSPRRAPRAGRESSSDRGGARGCWRSRSRAALGPWPGLEDAVGGAVGRVLQQDRADHADAARERVASADRDQRLAAQRRRADRTSRRAPSRRLPPRCAAPRPRRRRRARPPRRRANSRAPPPLTDGPVRRGSVDRRDLRRRRAAATARRRALAAAARARTRPTRRPARCSRSCPGR